MSVPIFSSIGAIRAVKAAAAAAAAAFFKSGSSLESNRFSVFADRGGGRKVRARKLRFSAECAEAAHIVGESSSRAENVQNLSARAFDTAENEFLQVRLLFLFENASKCMLLS